MGPLASFVQLRNVACDNKMPCNKNFTTEKLRFLLVVVSGVTSFQWCYRRFERYFLASIALHFNSFALASFIKDNTFTENCLFRFCNTNSLVFHYKIHLEKHIF